MGVVQISRFYYVLNKIFSGVLPYSQAACKFLSLLWRVCCFLGEGTPVLHSRSITRRGVDRNLKHKETPTHVLPERGHAAKRYFPAIIPCPHVVQFLLNSNQRI